MIISIQNQHYRIHLQISTPNFQHQNKLGHEIERNYRKSQCKKLLNLWSFLSKIDIAMIQSTNLNHTFWRIKENRCMVMTKLDTKLSEIIERNTLRNYSIHDNFYPKSTLQAFIYESQPQIFNNSKKKKIRTWNWENYRKSHCENGIYLESQSYTNYAINYRFYWKSTLQSSSLIIQTTHFEEIKTKRSVLVMKQIGHEFERNFRENHC